MKRTILALLPTGMVGAARPCGMEHGGAAWQYRVQCKHSAFLAQQPATTAMTNPSSRRPRSTTS